MGLTTEINLGAVVMLPPDALAPMPDQPRREFDESFITEELAQNIAQLRAEGLGLGGSGIEEPIRASLPVGGLDENGHLKTGQKLVIYSGESRWRAANFLNENVPESVPLLPVIITDLDAERAFELAYFANAHRRDISPYNEGVALLRIMRSHGINKVAKLARYVNKSYDHVRNRIEAVGDEAVAELLIERPDAVGMARRISAVKDEQLKTILIEAARQGANHRDIEDTIAAANQGLSLEKYRALKKIAQLETKERNFAAKNQPSAGKVAPLSSAKPTRTGSSQNSENSRDDTGTFLIEAITAIVSQTQNLAEIAATSKISSDDKARLREALTLLRNQSEALETALKE